MNRRSLPLALSGVLFALVAGCRDTTAPGFSAPADLVGEWATAPMDLSPNGWYEIRMTYGSDGAYTFEARDYGIYPGQARDFLSAYSRLEGSYRVEGDSIHRMARRETTWDSFYGLSSAPVVRDIAPNDYFINWSSKYMIVGSRLILDYYSYPADAPVATRMVLNKR